MQGSFLDNYHKMRVDLSGFVSYPHYIKITKSDSLGFFTIFVGLKIKFRGALFWERERPVLNKCRGSYY